MAEKTDTDDGWTRLTLKDDWDSASMAVLSVRDAGVAVITYDDWRNWEYRVELIVSESEATDAVPAGKYVVCKGHDLRTPTGVTDPMRPLESLASFLNNDREHLGYRDSDVCPEHGERCEHVTDHGCPEHGAKCVARTASAELRHFLTMWGEELGCWASEQEEARSE